MLDNQIEVTHADVSHCCFLARERLWNSGVPVRAVFLEPPELMRSQMIKKTARGDLASVWEKTNRCETRER